VALRNREVIGLGGDGVPEVFDELETLGQRETTQLFHEVAPGLRAVASHSPSTGLYPDRLRAGVDGMLNT
jgi:hypothetical protein